jgi:radical SAM-linked protein
MAFSAGFSPHPKISYLGAAPTGAASEAEYLEIGLSVRCDPEAVRAALDAALPDEVAVLDCVEAGEGTGSLADRIDTSVWRVELPGVTLKELQPAVDAFLASDVVTVAKRTKNGLKDIDARASVTSAYAAGEAGCAILHMVVRQGTPAVRPDDVLAALTAVADLRPPLPPRAVREAQGRLDDTGTVADPLGPDRVASTRCQGAHATI